MGSKILTCPSGVSAGHIIPHCELCSCLGLANLPGIKKGKLQLGHQIFIKCNLKARSCLDAKVILFYLHAQWENSIFASETEWMHKLIDLAPGAEEQKDECYFLSRRKRTRLFNNKNNAIIQL